MGLQFQLKEAVDHSLPEDTIFRARLVDLKLREFSWTRDGVKQNGSNLEWFWEIISPDEYAGRKVKGVCDPELTTGKLRRDRFRPWAEAILGRTIPFGMTLDVDDLIGLTADITVWFRADRKDPETKYAEVDLVMTPGGGEGGRPFSDEPPF